GVAGVVGSSTPAKTFSARSALAAHGEVRHAVDRLGKVEGDGNRIQSDVLLNHEMQMRTCAVAGISRLRQQVPGAHILSLTDLNRALLQVQIDPHGAVIMQHPHEVLSDLITTPLRAATMGVPTGMAISTA